MKSVLSLCIASLFFVACNQDLKTEEAATAETPNQQEFAIIIHGGAGTILKKNMTDSMEQAYKAKLTEAIKTGHEILKNGGSARESNPRFQIRAQSHGFPLEFNTYKCQFVTGGVRR